MHRLSVVQTGLLYRNPVPHLFARHAYYPSVVRLPDGAMLASFVIASAMESIDAQMYLARSDDDGRTWTDPAPLHEKSPTLTETGRITHVGGGRVVLLLSESQRPDPHVGAVNPANLGHVPTRFVLWRSDDGGRGWASLGAIDAPLVGPTFELCSPIVVLPDGRWLLPTSTWRGWDGEAPNGMKAVAFISDDQGVTWSRFVDVMNGTDRGVLFWEQKIESIDGNRLLAMSWAYHEPSRSDLPNHYALASQDSLQFSTSLPTSLQGQTPALLHLGAGVVLCVYRRTDEPGLWAATLLVEADNVLRVLDQQCLWRPMLPGKHDQREGLVEEFRGLKFGAPCLVRLDGDEVFLAFWCMEGCVSNIRWIRLRVASDVKDNQTCGH